MRQILQRAAAVFSCLLAAMTAPVSAQSATPRYVVSTLSGTNYAGHIDGSADRARFTLIRELTLGPDGAVYVTDWASIRRVTLDGTVTTVAGGPDAGFADGVGAAAKFSRPAGLAVTADGTIYVADADNGALRKIVGQTVTTVATGLGLVGGVAVSATGAIFVSTACCGDDGNVIWRVFPDGTKSLFAGRAGSTGVGFVDGTGPAARFNFPKELAFGPDGLLYVADGNNCAIRRISMDAVVTTFATTGACGGAGGQPRSIAFDPSGHLVVNAGWVLRISPAGVVTASGSFGGTSGVAAINSSQAIVANQFLLSRVQTSAAEIPQGVVLAGTDLFSINRLVDGPAATARHIGPGVIVAGTDAVYTGDYYAVRKISPEGMTTTLAGAGEAGPRGGVDGLGNAARFGWINDLAIAPDGSLYVVDMANKTIRHVTTSGVVSTLAGAYSDVSQSLPGTGTAARFNVPRTIAYGGDGALYVTSDDSLHRVTTAGVVTIIRALSGNSVVRSDAGGQLYLFDAATRTIVRIGFDGATLGTVYSAPPHPDTGLARSIHSFAVGPTGAFFFVYASGQGEGTANQIWTGSTPGQATSIAGRSAPGGQVASYVDGRAADARFFSLHSINVGTDGTVYVSDGGAYRKLARTAYAPDFSAHPESQTVVAGSNVTLTAAVVADPAPSLTWQISSNGGNTWASVPAAAPYAGVTSGSLTITGVPASLHGARYRVVASNSEGTRTSETALLTVRAPVSLTPASLRFVGTQIVAGGSVTQSTGSQSVTVLFTGAPGTWTVTASQPWLVVTGGAGTGSGQFTVAVASGVPAPTGTTVATLTLTSSAATNSPVTLPVTLSVAPGLATQAAIGQVDTPTQNAPGVQGAIAVTGWALDDLGVQSVKIFRNCLPLDNAASCQMILQNSPQQANVVYVGDAAFLAGARTDVETAFATYPQANRAGWGYLLLTSMLPHVASGQPYGGQGALTLYAVVRDVEGNEKLLGRSSDPTSAEFAVPTTITMANDSIAKPFGAIDTPTQGQVVSGVLNNFGWALTPDSNTTGGEAGDILIPTNGSTVTVFVDSLPVAQVAYNQCRGDVGNPVGPAVFCNDDVSNIFGNPTPQAALTPRALNNTRFRNLDAGRAPIGAYTFNTATLSNGLHTIAWSVTDSAGRTEGIGSRFFVVLNSGGSR